MLALSQAPVSPRRAIMSICVDIDKAKVEAMKNGIVPIYEPNLETLFDRNISAERLKFTTDLKEACGSRGHCVVFGPAHLPMKTARPT